MDRRNFIKSLIAFYFLNSSGLYATPFKNYTYFSSKKTDDIGTLEDFHNLSKWICCRHELNLEDTKKIFSVFEKEPYVKEHMKRSFQLIKDKYIINSESTDFKSIWSEIPEQDGIKWFIGHVFTTWYLGIYYYEGIEPQKILHETSLMYLDMHDLGTVPFINPIGYAAWAGIAE
jgi:hypothetical protein